MSQIIKVGFCIAYDWELLKYSLPPVYKHSDVICLSIDKERRSWAGKKYEFNETAFNEFIEKSDPDKKIQILEGDYSNTTLTARENCNLQRTEIAGRLGGGGWHIQVDVDEYFTDFKGFREFLLELNPHPTGKEKPVNVCVNLIPIYKKIDNGYLLVDFENDLPESAPFATNVPDYQRARNNGHFNKLSPFYAIHETWARSEEQLIYKLNNWGHSSEELNETSKREEYIIQWKEMNDSNFEKFSNVHPATPATWPRLSFIEAGNTNQLLQKIGSPKFPMNRTQLFLRNNRNIARIKQLF